MDAFLWTVIIVLAFSIERVFYDRKVAKETRIQEATIRSFESKYNEVCSAIHWWRTQSPAGEMVPSATDLIERYRLAMIRRYMHGLMRAPEVR